MDEFNAKTDGVNHINVYSKGKTELGRLLSNFAETMIKTTEGDFPSVESWWYWIKMKNINASCLIPLFDENNLHTIRHKPGKAAKEYFRFLYKQDSVHSSPTKKQLKEIYKLKIEQYPSIKKLLLKNELPLTHYYIMFEKKVSADEYMWTVQLWDEIKKENL